MKNMSRTDMLLAMRVLEAFDLVLIMERLDDPQVSEVLSNPVANVGSKRGCVKVVVQVPILVLL